MKDKYILYRTYEVIPQVVAGAKPNKPILFSWVGNVWSFLIDQLIGSNEPRIWQECNRSGEIYWRVYDPYTGRSAYCDSEDEVRAWLEQLPYFH